jgi:peptidoglycan/LPS O-acetylase OafA/YrhL
MSDNISRSSSPEYYAAMDGFRGILSVVVAIYHTAWISHPQAWRFFENGPVIIDLFFAFSGFLMWRLYSERLKSGADMKKFMKRRFARLYPLHIFMILVFLAFAVARLLAHKIGLAEQTPGEILPFQNGSLDNWFSLLQNLTMTNAMGFSEALTFNPPSWTIGAEFYTYIIFAAMMVWFKPKLKVHFILITACIGLIYVYLSRLKPDMNITYDYGFLRCIAGFYSGILAAVCFPKIRLILQRLSSASATMLEAFVIVASILFVIYLPGKAQFFIGLIVFAFVVVFASDRGVVSKFMSHSIFQYLAKISYSVYLVHTIIAIVFGIFLKILYGALPTGWIGDAWLALYLCVVIGVSHCTYHLIELPGGKFLRNWNKPKKQVAKADTSA